MNNQEITDNAPDNATHYDCCEYMRHVYNGNWEYWSKASGWEETVPEDDTRSLADIKRIVELEKALHELIDRASECDSWESFPQSWLDEAHDVIMESK
jgi:hypothetical protein